MSWEELCKDKIVSAKEAVSKIKSGDRVVLGPAVGEPLELVKAMVENREQYRDVEIVHMLAMGESPYAQPGMEKYFHYNSFFVGKKTRDAVDSGRADYTPCFFYELPKLFKEGYLPVDVALVELSVPDEHGFCSFGVSNVYAKAGAECAKLVIAEINENMPRVMGNSFIHISQIDYMVKVSYPIPEIKPAKIGNVEKAIGKYCASLIDDGSTLQLGIGGIPDAVLLFLKDKKDLGLHTEMLSDGVVELVKSGVVTNKKKTLHPGKAIASFCMGTKALYDFIDNNPMVEAYPVEYVNDPTVIMKNSKMVSINSCVEVDLMGQVCAESIGTTQISSVGGQIDFIRGTSMAKEGKSIIAMTSTAAKGKVSKIVPFLKTGTPITTSRNDVQYIVTEYGIAQLKGKTLRQRAKALINIAHPNFRKGLIDSYEERFNCKYE